MTNQASPDEMSMESMFSCSNMAMGKEARCCCLQRPTAEGLGVGSWTTCSSGHRAGSFHKGNAPCTPSEGSTLSAAPTPQSCMNIVQVDPEAVAVSLQHAYAEGNHKGHLRVQLWQVSSPQHGHLLYCGGLQN